MTAFLYRRVPALASLRNYGPAHLRGDLIAGLTVATVAVPQAMAYGLAAGVGAEFGLYTAIVMTAVGAVLASSKELINGPTNVLAIATLSALAAYPPEDKVRGAITLCLLVGAFQTAITLLRLGDLTRYISHSVVVGFTAGASLLLVLDQVRNLLGWPAGGDAHDHFLVRLYETWTAGGPPHRETTLVGFGSIAAILVLRWLKRRLSMPLFPELLVVVLGAGYLSARFGLHEAGVAVVGAIPPKLPSLAVPDVRLEDVRLLGGSALAIATLGLLEALAMSKHLAAQTGDKLDVNQQCLSEGLANVAGSFFFCIPGSGSLTRSAINHQAGARTQWSGVISAIAVAAIVLLFAPWAEYVPRAALAGLLMVSAFRMIDWSALAFHLRATRFDAVIVLLTGLAAVAISVEFCILIGVFASFLLAVPRAGRITLTEFVVGQDGIVHEREEGVVPKDERVPIFGLEGELFFGSSIVMEEHLAEIARRVDEIVVLRVKRLRNPDAVGLFELGAFVRLMKARGVRVILAGVRPELLDGLQHTGILDELDMDTQVFAERTRKGTATILAIRATYAWLEERDRASPRRTPSPSLNHFQD